MFNVARKQWRWVKDNPVSDGDLSFSVGNRNARDRWLTIEKEQTLLEKVTNPVVENAPDYCPSYRYATR